eukprot:220837_1
MSPIFWLYSLIAIRLHFDATAFVHAQNQSNFICDDNNICSQQTLICNQNADCSIKCNGTIASCVNSTFICPHGPYNCHFTCIMKMYQCQWTKINASHITDATLTVAIGTTGGFYRGHAICPITGNCSVFSTLSKALVESTFDASNMIAGDLIIEAVQIVTSNNPNAERMRVECPPYGRCIVNVGTSVRSCHRCAIIAQRTTTLLSITAKGASALESADIFCPAQRTGEAPNCIINDPGNYQRVFRNLDIRSVASYSNLQLTCTRCSDVELYSIKMYCMDGYSELCYLSWISSSEWKCRDGTNPCQDWTINATRNPTANPSKSPSDHTLPPTKYPTINPTKTPTNTPTLVPTSVTSIPTRIPTFYPSKTRTIPTTHPTQHSTDSSYLFGDVKVVRYAIVCGLSIVLVCILVLVICCCDFGRKQGAQNTIQEQNRSTEDFVLPVDNETKGRNQQLMDDEFIVDSDSEDDNYDREPQVIDVTGGTTKQDNILPMVPMYTIGNVSIELQMKRAQRNVLEVQYWLENVVRLPSYYDIMIRNGYDSLAIVREIKSITELKQIGIESRVDQSVILKEIEELRQQNDRLLGRMFSGEGRNDMMMTQEGGDGDDMTKFIT